MFSLYGPTVPVNIFAFMVMKQLLMILPIYILICWFDFVIGILLCAKTKLAKTHLAAYFADGTSSIEGNRFVEKTPFSFCFCMLIVSVLANHCDRIIIFFLLIVCFFIIDLVVFHLLAASSFFH